jgi:hypothetical protein
VKQILLGVLTATLISTSLRNPHERRPQRNQWRRARSKRRRPAGVDITVTPMDTGIVRTAVTNATGSCVLRNVPLGPYRFEPGLAGFRSFVHTGIVLHVNGSNGDEADDSRFITRLRRRGLGCDEVEFGWGARVENNAYFGIKGKTQDGEGTTFTTHEFVDGKKVVIKDTFRAYASFAEAAEDYGAFLSTNPRYKSCFEVSRNPMAFVERLHAAGYATDPAYATKLQQIIRTYYLDDYDR